MKRVFAILFLWACALAWLPFCGDDDDNDTAADAGMDTDVDSDTDSDTDGDTDDLEAWSEEKYLSVTQVYELFTAGNNEMLLLNVVDEEYYDLGMIEGSIVIPWDLLFDNLDAVDPERHVVIYCRLGVRSEDAYETLQENGYELIWIMDGGILDWLDAGYPVVPVEEG